MSCSQRETSIFVLFVCFISRWLVPHEAVQCELFSKGFFISCGVRVEVFRTRQFTVSCSRRLKIFVVFVCFISR